MSEATATLTPAVTTPAETPAAKGEANATPNEAAKGTPDATAEGTTGQAGTAEGETPAAAPPSPVDEAVKAAESRLIATIAERYGVEGEFETVEDLDAAIETRDRAAREEQNDAQSQTYYRDMMRKIDADLSAFTDEDGNPLLSPEQRQGSVFNKLNEFRANVRTFEQQENLNELADVALAIIPEANADAFLKAVDGKDLSLEQWLPQVVEHAAPASRFVKKLLADHKVDLAKSRAEGWKEGNAAPAGQPSADNVAAGNSGTKLTRASFASMSLNEQADAWKTRPDEVRAL